MPLTRLLNAFIGNFVDGSGLLTPVAMGLLVFFLGIELSFVGVNYMIDNELNPRPLMNKCIMATVLGFFILNWPWFCKQFVNVWVSWGLQASRGALQVTDVTDPDSLAAFGFAATGVIFQHLAQYSGWEAIKNLLEVWLSGFVAILVILFYFGLASWVMVSLIEFYMGAVVTILLLPWGMSSTVGFVAEKAIGHLIASGVRLFVLAFLLGVSLPIMITLNTTAPKNLAIPLIGPNFVQALYALAGAIGLGMLCWRAGAFSAGLMYGAPQLSPRDVTSYISMLTTQATRISGGLNALAERLGQGATPGRRI